MGADGIAVRPLQGGERMRRNEFERRFDATPGLKRAELVEGTVWIPPQMGEVRYGSARMALIGLIGSYCAATPGVSGGAHGHIRLDAVNMPQPDVSVHLGKAYGGQSRIDADGYLEGAPEFVADVVRQRAEWPTGRVEALRRNGVREFAVWRVDDCLIDWFVVRDGKQERLEMGADGVYRSRVLPGLWVDPVALLTDERARAMAVMRQGIASPEQGEFIERLKRAAGKV